MVKSIEVEANQEVRTTAGTVIARSGETVDLRDDQPFGWPLYLIDATKNAVIETLE